MVIQSTLPTIKIPEISIIEFLFKNTHNVPEDRKILIDALTGESLTYAQFKDNVLRFAASLQDNFGFKKGDVVAIYSPNQMDYSVPLLGAVAAGGATSPANPAYTSKELAYQLEMTKAKILIAHPTNVASAMTAADLVGLSRSNVFVFGNQVINDVVPYSQVFLSSKRRAAPIELTAEEAKDTVAYLCFSSGTTGKSKGVMTTHTNMNANICQYEALDGKFINGTKDRMVGILPFFHIFGLTFLLHTSLYLGIPVHVMTKFDLTQFCKTIEREKITLTCLAPPVVLHLAKNPIVDQYDLSSLRLVICGAAPLGPDLAQEVKRRLTKLIIKQGYGLTETSPFAVVEPTDRIIDGSIGLLLSNMTAKIINEDGQEVNDGRGELCLKGPNIMKGYINNPEATADCIDAEGYFHTGDVVVQDENGHFYIVDRIKELIKYKGFQVPPAELEAILLTSPIVADCAVIGIYDEEQATELPRGYITLKPDIPANEEIANAIKKFVAGQVVYYKQLRSVVFIDEIPKSSAGKILRRILRDAAAAEKAQQKLKAKL